MSDSDFLRRFEVENKIFRRAIARELPTFSLEFDLRDISYYAMRDIGDNLFDPASMRLYGYNVAIRKEESRRVLVYLFTRIPGFVPIPDMADALANNKLKHTMHLGTH